MSNAFIELRQWCIYYPVVAVIIVLIVAAISILFYNLISDDACDRDSFTNKSPLGYRYDVDTLSFPTPEDKTIAFTEVVKVLAKDGMRFTVADLVSRRVPSHYIISILESEDGDDTIAMKANLAMYLDANNQTVKQLINKASASITPNRFSEQEREMIYNLLSVYFNALKTPMRFPLKEWSNDQLAKTYQSRKLPLDTEFSSKI